MKARFLLLLVLVLVPLRASAGAWTQPRGALWLKIGGIAAASDSFYASQRAVLADGTRIAPGDVRPYDDNGTARQRSVFFEAELGVTDRLALGLQAPWKELRFEDDVQVARSWGWGDPRVAVRFAVGEGDDRITVRGAAKLPWGRTSTELGRIPIGENQTDLEIGLQWGRSLGRPLSWVGVEAHRRFRLRDDELEVDPGDEWFGHIEAGWGLDAEGRWGIKSAWQRVRGDESSLNFFAPGTTLARDLDQLLLLALVDLDQLFVELGAQRTLGSESYPVGWEWIVGLSRRVELGF